MILKRSLSLAALLAFSFSTLAFAASKTYTLDKAHSSVTFKVKHLLVYTTGNFEDFDASLEFDAGNLASLKTEATVAAKSINTSIKKRDDHLRSPDFFDVEKYPSITLKNVKVTATDAKKGTLQGDLTLHGVTKPVTFDLEYLGESSLDNGGKQVGFYARTTINRKHFGLTWSKTSKAGELIVGDDVTIELNIAADESAAAQDDAKGKKKDKGKKK